MFEILVTPRARRQLRRLARKEWQAFTMVELAISSLAAWPEVKQVKALTAHESRYRLRTGRYRVLFDVEPVMKIIHVQEVRRRDDHTY
ncbi:MAG TPA: hypothetical protein VFN03_03830 [Trueperaceae bacterium]|nr:hypothetical protein [Trueperaceae bacterium]